MKKAKDLKIDVSHFEPIVDQLEYMAEEQLIKVTKIIISFHEINIAKNN